MSARRARTRCLAGVMLGLCGTVLAADNELPEADFLEYLGSWEESDEEWLIFEDEEKVALETDERIDPAPDGEESAEKDDEG